MNSWNTSDKDTTLPCQSKDTLDIMKEKHAQNHLNILTFLSQLEKANRINTIFPKHALCVKMSWNK